MKGIENWRTKSEIESRRGRRRSLEKMKHVFGSLLEIILGGEGRKGNFFREEINSEYVTFRHGIGKVALVAPIVFKRGPNVPANLAVLTECGTRSSTDVGDNSGAKRSNGCSIEIVVAEEGSMSR